MKKRILTDAAAAAPAPVGTAEALTGWVH